MAFLFSFKLFLVVLSDFLITHYKQSMCIINSRLACPYCHSNVLSPILVVVFFYILDGVFPWMFNYIFRSKGYSLPIQQTRNKHILNDTCAQIRKEQSALTKYRIMSFDGGGTLGALSLQLLNRLAQQNPKLISQTNVFSGNSIGSFTALALASGRTPKETLQFFKDKILPAFSVSRPGGPVFNQQLPYSGFIKAVRTFFPPVSSPQRLKKTNCCPCISFILTGAKSLDSCVIPQLSWLSLFK